MGSPLMKRLLVFTIGLVTCLRVPAALSALIQRAKIWAGILMGLIALDTALGETSDIPVGGQALGFDQVLFVKRHTYNANHYYTQYVNSAWRPGEIGRAHV